MLTPADLPLPQIARRAYDAGGDGPRFRTLPGEIVLEHVRRDFVRDAPAHEPRPDARRVVLEPAPDELRHRVKKFELGNHSTEHD